MKILILANSDIGLYKFRRELISELAKENKLYISFPRGQFVKELTELGCEFIDTSIDRRGKNPFNDLKLLKKYKKMIKQIGPDFVITYTIKPNIYGGMVCKKNNINYASNITGLGTAFQRKGILNLFVCFLYRKALKKAKIVFFENEDNKKIFEEKRIINERQGLLLNGAGVNLDTFSLSPYPKNDGTINFLFIGRVMKEKGIEELFDATRNLFHDGKKVHLDVVGDYEEDYRRIIEVYESEGWLSYHGFQNDVRQFIEKCHCFVLPSWHEGMANTNLECAASGRPVITTNIPGCKESVIDGVSGFLVERKNANNLYECMKRFCSIPQNEKKQMGINGRKHIERNFDKFKVVNKTIEAIKTQYGKCR